ncbi:MAG: hypothetical protein EBZ47_02505 [Chlamydiae bacterium]|nr:hypothetical protein [Chlamydiota bacterium]
MHRNKIVYLILANLYFLLSSSILNAKTPCDLNSLSMQCEREDIPRPIDSYPVSHFNKSITTIYDLIFSSFLSESDQMYLNALIFIIDGKFNKAKEILNILLDKNPCHIFAKIQLGYLYLWGDQLFLCKKNFLEPLLFCPCNHSIIQGLSQLALAFDLKQGEDAEALEIYKKLHLCEPSNPDFMYAIGKYLFRSRELEESEFFLKQAANLSPNDSDIALLLANLYVQQGRFEEADAIYSQHQDRIESIEGRGKIALAKSEFQRAEDYYLLVLEKDPNNLLALQNLSRIEAIELKFTKAKSNYLELVQKDPSNPLAWQELYNVKLHTDPAVNYNISFVEAKENDPNLNRPVVRDYYFDNHITILAPITDAWRVDSKLFFMFQKEKSILPSNPGVNYNADISGAGFVSRYVFKNYWSWELFANFKRAWNVGDNFFPFQNTTRFEPGTFIRYSDDVHFFHIGADVDSYVIKNFSLQRAQLLTLRSIETSYSYSAPIDCKPQIGIALQETYFIMVPHNRRDDETISCSFFLPFTKEYLKIFYDLEHRHFHLLNINYYSFSQQWRNTVGMSLFYKNVPQGLNFDLTYWYRAQNTKNLYQPIGNLIYIAPRQFLNCYQIQANMEYRWKSNFVADVSAGYYRDTLPYRAWNLSAKLYWVF